MVPSVALAAGAHEIRVRIPWHERPQSLHVPAAIGIVALSVDGKPVVPVQRDGDEADARPRRGSAPEADSLDLHVYRKLEDGVPAMLTTRDPAGVSGQAREDRLGPVLPDGFAPLS